MKLLKKSMLYFGLTLILMLSLLGTASSVSAAPNMENTVIKNEVTINALTKYVEVFSVWFGPASPPETIEYDRGGYRGTLRILSSEYNKVNKRFESTYGGTVKCLGGCVLYDSIEEER